MGKCVHGHSDDLLKKAGKFRATGLFIFGCLVLVLTSLENIFFEYVQELKLLFKMPHTHVEVMSACFLFGTFFVLPFNFVYEKFGFYGSNFVGFTLAGSGLLLTGMAAMMPEKIQNLNFLVALFQFMVSHGRAHLYYLTVHVTITVTPEKHRGKVMGFMVSLIVVGQMLFTEIYHAIFHSLTATSYFFFFGFSTTTISTVLYVTFYALTNDSCCTTSDDVKTFEETLNTNNCSDRGDDTTSLEVSRKKTYDTFNPIRKHNIEKQTGCCKVLNKDANRTNRDFIWDYESIWTGVELVDETSKETSNIQGYYRRYIRNIKAYNKNLQDNFKIFGQCNYSGKESNIPTADFGINSIFMLKEDIRNEAKLTSLNSNICCKDSQFQKGATGITVRESMDISSDKCSKNNTPAKTEPCLNPTCDFCIKGKTSVADSNINDDNINPDIILSSSFLVLPQGKECEIPKKESDVTKVDQQKYEFCEILSNRTFHLFLWPSATVIFSAFLFLNNIGLVLQSMQFVNYRRLVTLSNLFVTLICRIIAGIFYDIFEKDFNRILMLTSASICNVLSYILSAVWMDSELVFFLAVLSNGVSMGVSLTTCLAHCGNVLGFVNKGRVQAILMTVVGVALFASSLLVGSVYDVIGDMEIKTGSAFICYGAECYKITYMIFGIFNVIGTALFIILLTTTLFKKQKQ